MTLTHRPFSIAPLAVALPLTCPLLPLLLLFLAPGRCYRSWVLTIYQFFYLSLSLRSFAPTSVPLPSIFRNGFASYFDSHCPSAEEYSSLSLSSAAALFTSLTLNAAKSFIPFGRIKRPPKAWWSAEVEQAVSERRKAFAAAHRSDEDRQAYISASRRASSVIAKAKAEAWQTTCSSLSPKSNPKSVHSLLCSIAGSPSSSSFSPNFPNCSSPRESASVYASYLRSHFSVSQPKALPSTARGYLSELRRATCPVESHSSFCSPFSLAELLAAASNLSSSTATGPDKVAYPMLKHLPRSGLDFLLHIFNLSWSLHSFPSIWKTCSIIPIHKMVKLLDSPASFRPISLTSCVSKLFERIILSRSLFFLESNSILSPRHHRLPLVLPYPSSSLEASLSPLRVTLTYFTLLSYEQALRLPTSFSISGLARLGVKPRLCRSSWRAFVSTHPLMLPFTSPREALLACPPCPPWNLHFFTVESTFSTPCSRSDPPLSPRCGSRSS